MRVNFCYDAKSIWSRRTSTATFCFWNSNNQDFYSWQSTRRSTTRAPKAVGRYGLFYFLWQSCFCWSVFSFLWPLAQDTIVCSSTANNVLMMEDLYRRIKNPERMMKFFLRASNLVQVEEWRTRLKNQTAPTKITVHGELMFEASAPDSLPANSSLEVKFEDVSYMDASSTLLGKNVVDLSGYNKATNLRYEIKCKKTRTSWKLQSFCRIECGLASEQELLDRTRRLSYRYPSRR